MFTKFDRHMKLTAIIGMVLVFGLSAAWAVQTHSASKVIRYRSGNTLKVIHAGNNQHILAQITAGSLDAYMAENSLNQVTITCELTEEWVDTGGGNGYYKLSFVFGPSGVYFDPDPLILKIKGKWVANNTEFWLYDENGEAIVGKRTENADLIKFEIPHFSCYYYENYCY